MDCCKVNNKSAKKCIRKNDNKEFTFPRLIPKSTCLTLKKPIKGFTRRASCAPYKYCSLTNEPNVKRKRKRPRKKLKRKRSMQKGGSKSKNINNKQLKICSTNPMTGYYRNGFCETGYDDFGTHTVCAKMDQKFLDYTASKGNDLSSVVKPDQKWCLCEYRWNQAYQDGKAPKVIKNATNFLTKPNIVQNIRVHSKKHSKKQK